MTDFDGNVRLIGGSTASQGRVEIYSNTQWNTVCDDDWDLTDASVVCRQLGYLKAIESYSDAYFGEGSGDILLSGVSCTGEESRILDCSLNNLYNVPCSHSEDAGVKCEEPGKLYHWANWPIH